MTSLLIYLLDTLLIGVSFFNTIVMLWLGLTVILNAERRGWGTWAAGGGLLLGAAFFAVHSSVVGQAVWEVGSEMALWWRVGWVPFVAAPYLWYVVMAWYSGALRLRRHRIAAGVVGLLGAAALALLAVANPIPSYDDITSRASVPVWTFGGIAVVVLIYPAFSVLCVALSLLMLRQPITTERFMGEIGRERARPWLVAASLGLLAVSVVAGVGIGWLLDRVRSGTAPLLSTRSLAAILVFDLVLSLLIAVVVVLIGQAVVAYEIFTGKALPRGGLARYWRGALLLAAVFSLIVGASTDLPFAPIYQVVLLTLLVAALYALFSWQAFVERERGVERLRPFVASQRLYDHALGPHHSVESEISAPFRALCDDVLDARVAYLVPLGALAALAPPPLVFGATQPPANLAGLAPMLAAQHQLCLPIEPKLYGGAGWAVPLWSERGLIGALLLGEKRDGGLYTQEEIEIGRAAGERLIDSEASAELARRLITLQRQRLAESQILDRRTRRVLHDDVLPKIHTALLQLSATRGHTPIHPPSNSALTNDERRPTKARISVVRPSSFVLRRKHQTSSNGELTLPDMPFADLQSQLAEVHGEIANLLRELPPTAELELIKLGLGGALRHVVESELRGAFDGVTWQITLEANVAAAQLAPLNAEVVFYAARELLRNAARYGRGGDPARKLLLEVAICIDRADSTAQLSIIVADDGVGHGAAQHSGGSGQGLMLHSTLLAVIGGTLSSSHRPGGGTCATITLPCG